jgi:4'-phosphopantetheinyl transferase
LDFLPAPDRLDPPLDELHVWRVDASPSALQRVLAVYLGLEPGRIRLTEGEHGKPRLAGPQGQLEFNLSHSGELALVAVSGEREVGIDVERVKPRREEGYYWGWVCREAHVKCLGIGLLRARRALPEEPVAVKPIDVGPGWAAAVAAAGPELPPLQGWTLGLPLHKDG